MSKRARLDLEGGRITIWISRTGGIEARTEAAVGDGLDGHQVRVRGCPVHLPGVGLR